MKLTRKMLRKMILEEKALLTENSPIANAQRMQGTYSDVSAISAVENAIAELMAGTDQSAFEDFQDEDEADEMAVAAVTLTVAETLQSLGMLAQYDALIRTLR